MKLSTGLSYTELDLAWKNRVKRRFNEQGEGPIIFAVVYI